MHVKELLVEGIPGKIHVANHNHNQWGFSELRTVNWDRANLLNIIALRSTNRCLHVFR